MASPGLGATAGNVGQLALFRRSLPDPATAGTGDTIAPDIIDVVQHVLAADFFIGCTPMDDPT